MLLLVIFGVITSLSIFRNGDDCPSGSTFSMWVKIASDDYDKQVSAGHTNPVCVAMNNPSAAVCIYYLTINTVKSTLSKLCSFIVK